MASMASAEEDFASVQNIEVDMPTWNTNALCPMCVSTSSDGWSEGGFDRLSPRSSDRLSFLHSNASVPSVASPHQIKRIGQMATALVAELCYQDGQCGDVPLQPPTTLDELESVMQHALLQCSEMSQQHQTVASQLANTKLHLATLQEEVIVLRHELARASLSTTP